MPNEADPPARPGLSRFASENRHAAAPRLVEAGQNPQQGRLSSTIASNQRQAGTRLCAQPDVPQGWEIAIELPDALNGDGAHSFLSRPAPHRSRPRQAAPGRAAQNLAPGCPAPGPG